MSRERDVVEKSGKGIPRSIKQFGGRISGASDWPVPEWLSLLPLPGFRRAGILPSYEQLGILL